MSLALVHGRARAGVHAPEVRIEVYLAGGLPRMTMVGLPEAAVRESRDRVRAEIRCGQFEFPQRAITINPAPPHLTQDGGPYDPPTGRGTSSPDGRAEGKERVRTRKPR